MMAFPEDLSTTKQVHALNSIKPGCDSSPGTERWQWGFEDNTNTFFTGRDGRISLGFEREQLMVNYWANLQGYSASPTKDILHECWE